MNFVKSNSNMTYRIISKDAVNKSEPKSDFHKDFHNNFKEDNKQDFVSDSTKSSNPKPEEKNNKLSKIGSDPVKESDDSKKLNEIEKSKP